MSKAVYHKDLHAILGVSEQAGPDELRQAYLALAVKYHPDHNPDRPEAEERFKDISQAYAILSDPAARARYERLRPPKKPARPGPASPGSEKAGPERATNEKEAGEKAPEPGFEEILTSFFNSARGRETLKDLEKEMTRAGLQFKMEDLTRWFKNYQRPPDPAPAAQNKSWLTRLLALWPKSASPSRSLDIHFQLSLTAPAAAAGATVDITYQRDGAPQRLQVRIPAGIKNGARLRLAGQGRLGPGETRGALILTVLVGAKSVQDLWS
ncbi:MAG: DnaJ domain-containing protein [Candidatus Adiutrix sp.]|jgi:DnaJ-class molecular chaperone|nr:DnaJ domain-containing protein [Candidatus Adiutrix sp.]